MLVKIVIQVFIQYSSVYKNPFIHVSIICSFSFKIITFLALLFVKRYLILDPMGTHMNRVMTITGMKYFKSKYHNAGTQNTLSRKKDPMPFYSDFTVRLKRHMISLTNKLDV